MKREAGSKTKEERGGDKRKEEKEKVSRVSQEPRVGMMSKAKMEGNGPNVQLLGAECSVWGEARPTRPRLKS